MPKLFILALGLSLPVLSCGGSETPVSAGATAAEAPAEAPEAQEVAVESAVRELRCGCKIDSVGHCGNYVAVGDEWLEISNPKEHGLSNMEWCGVPDNQMVKGTVAGERTGDTIQVTTLEIAGR